MTKTKIALIFLMFITATALGGSLYVSQETRLDPERGGGISDDPASGSAVLGETQTVVPPPVNLATVPLLQLEWERVITSVGTKYKNGDFVIRENQTLQLAPNSVNSTNIARHTIRSEDIDHRAITSRTIEDHTIVGADIAGNTDIDIASLVLSGGLTVGSDADITGDLTVSGTITGSGGLDLAGNLGIRGLAYTWPSVHSDGVLSNDGTGTLVWQTLGAASITNDSLDFTEFKDAMTLDVSTDIALGALTLSTSGTGAVSFNHTGLLTVAGNIDFNGTGTNDIAGTLNLSGNALTSSGALTITPAAGNNFNLNLSTTGDFAVNTSQFYVDTSTGNVGIGTTSPTAVLHLKAGTASANTAPLKFTSGTLLTTAEAGAIEFLTDTYYGTITTGAVRKTFAFLESPIFTTPTLGVATATSLVIGANTLDTTEWANLDGLNQTLATTSSPTFVGLTVSGLTASQLLATDGSKNLVSLAVATYPSLTELTYVKGVTSALQTQLDGKQPLDAQLTDIAGLAVTDNNFIVGNGTNFVAESGATVRTSLGLGTIATEAEGNYALLAGRSGGQILTGGTGTTDDLTLKTTSGVGATGADMHFLVGNNGGTEAMTILNSGNVGIGTTSPGAPLEVTSPSSGNSPALILKGTNSLPLEFSDLAGGADSHIWQMNVNSGSFYFRSFNDARSSFTNIWTATRSGNVTLPNGTLTVSGTGNSSIAGNVGIGTASPTNILSLGNGAAQKFWIENTATDVVGRALTVAAGSTIAGTSVSDVVGGNLILQSGLGTGTGDSSIAFQTGTTLTTGTTLQTMSTKMTILGNGNVGIGTTSPGAKLNVVADTASDYATEIFNDGNATTRWGLLVQAGLDDQTAVGPSTLVQFNDGDGGAVGSITFGSSVTNYNTSSDVRLKTNIADSLLGIDDLMRIQVRDYTWRADDNNRIAHGFIAQELYDVYPDAVTVPQDDRYWMVDYSKLTPLIVKSIQDQQGEIVAQGEQLVSVSLQTTQNITTVSELQASVDDELLVVSGSINTLNDSLITQEEALKALKKVLAEQSDRIASLETQNSDANWQGSFDTLSSRSDLLESGLFSLTSNVSLLTSQVETLTEFYTTLGLGNLLSKDNEGNIDLGKGIFTAKEIKADEGRFKKITIESGGKESTVTGKSEIKEGETIVIIETVAAEKDSNIMVTPRATFDGSLAVTNVETGKSFTVEIMTPANTDIPFTWWIVGQENVQ